MRCKRYGVSLAVEVGCKHYGVSHTTEGWAANAHRFFEGLQTPSFWGTIYLEHSGAQLLFLNAGGSYPNNPLTLVIWGDTRKQFENKPEEFYKDKNVSVFGKVELYMGKAQVVVWRKGQVVVE